MKNVSKHFRIITYGDSFSDREGTRIPSNVRGVPVLKRWRPARDDMNEFLLVASEELDDKFAQAFRDYATELTHLLVFRHHGESADRLVSRIIDLKIRTPHRFCVLDASVASGKTHSMLFVTSVLNRLAASVDADDENERVLNATIDDGVLHIVSTRLNRLDVSIEAVPVLKNAEVSDLRPFEIDEDGAFIYWPNLDVHLGWTQLHQLANPEAALKARQKNDDFNRKYGRAVQQLREATGVRPGDISGLSEKQLGRIERGECRLTSNGIEALAHAHHLKPNDYMKALAQLLG
jgi:hypothetical protein